MIRMIQSNSAGHAKAYFTDALSKSDYYINDQELQGHFHGKLAERLGILGVAEKSTFNALCENINPLTGKLLTQRLGIHRRVGYDINFHCPKSVSILHSLARDSHILDAFTVSVQETMKDIEADSKTRVRINGADNDRTTGNLAWAEFVHQTARPVDGSLPDPHLHAHCFVFNATFDELEKRIKAASLFEVKRSMPYYQARFQKRLADRLADLGYAIRRTETSFEIDGVPQKIVDHFSKRTDEIGRIAKEKGIVNKKALDALGATTRSKKQASLSMSELKKNWKAQIQKISVGLKDNEFKPVRFPSNPQPQKLTKEKCVQYAAKHAFERASVMEDRKLLAAAYRHALGHSYISIDAITNSMKEDKSLLHIEQRGINLCTTRDVLAEEQRMVNLAKAGRGTLVPIYDKEIPFINLEGQQYQAVLHVLSTSNRVCIIRGAAGAGKTTLMKEAVTKINAAGKKVTVVAPTADASRGVLRMEGFKGAETVAKLLLDKRMQEALKDQVLWVDEAGLLGTKDMLSLLRIATKQNARLILGGDTRQHSAVVRGDALRILSTVGGIKSAEVTKIYRQHSEHYKAAVDDLSKGNLKDGFDKLDKMNAIKSVDPLNPNEQLVEDYVAAIKAKRTALVISPTHKQGEAVTQAIRAKLREIGKIGKKEVYLDKLDSLNLTEAQKKDWRSYQKGQVVKFSQNIKKIQRGSAWVVSHSKDSSVTIVNKEGEKRLLPLNKANHFSVYELSQLGISKGDIVRITHNGFDKNKKRLDNGMMLEVSGVSKFGKIKLKNKKSNSTYELRRDYGHIAHAHCVTSHSSQGKTVDEVLIAQPASTFDATDAKQFYVSVSRGKYAARVYTDDREGLIENVNKLGDRQSAIELTKSQDAPLQNILRTKQKDFAVLPAVIEKFKSAKDIIKKPTREYEPSI